MLALVRDDTVIERRDLSLTDVPEHKRYLWRHVVIEGDGPIEQAIVEKDRVRLVRSQPPPPPLPDKTELMARIDAAALVALARYKTPGFDLIYAEKFAQAQAVEAMGKDAANKLSDADAVAQFPLLAAAVGLDTTPTLYVAAEQVLMAYAQFAQSSMLLERARLSGKQAIASAKTIDAAAAAFEAVKWPT